VPEEPAAGADAAPADQAAAEPEAQAEPQQDEQPKATGWAVQLVSASTEDAAWASWEKMKARNKALAAKKPVVVRADLGAKGVFYRVRLVGFDSQSDASSECSRLKSRGVKCYISKAES
jgi:cell division septation protein DedD